MGSIKPGAGASGATVLTQIAQVVVGAPQATVDFPAIAALYESLEIDLYGASSAAATAATVGVRFNNDSGANYDAQYIFWRNSATAEASANAMAATSMMVVGLPAASSTALDAGVARLFIPGYARTSLRKSVSVFNMFENGLDAGNPVAVNMGGGHWRSAAAIDRVTLILSAGNFVTGTVATLYGRGRPLA